MFSVFAGFRIYRRGPRWPSCSWLVVPVEPGWALTSSAFPIQRTLLHRIRTCPRVPELTPLTKSSVFETSDLMFSGATLWEMELTSDDMTRTLLPLFQLQRRRCNGHLDKRRLMLLAHHMIGPWFFAVSKNCRRWRVSAH
jgi:hypothetical protein